MSIRSHAGLLLAVLGVVLSLSLAACHSHELPEVDCDTAEVPSFTDLAILDNCVQCHASDKSGAARQGAPSGINFDNYGDAVDEAEHGVSEVFEGEMPPSGASALSEADKEMFYNWGLCGTPQ